MNIFYSITDSLWISSTVKENTKSKKKIHCIGGLNAYDIISPMTPKVHCGSKIIVYLFKFS